MKLPLWGLGLLAYGLAFTPEKAPTRVFVSGELNGYLSPCGCTKPMSGGIRRRAAAIRAIAGREPYLVLEMGPLVDKPGRQSEIKAETFAEAFREMGGTAMAWTEIDARMGPTVLEAVHRLSGGAVLLPNGPNSASGFQSSMARGPFQIVSLAHNTTAMARDTGFSFGSAKSTLEDVLAQSRSPIIAMFDGTLDQAEKVGWPTQVVLVVYRGPLTPETKLRYRGETAFVPAGREGKRLIGLKWDKHRWAEFRLFDLGPQFADDARVSLLFRDYQSRVRRERLLDTLPRVATAAYAGTKTCLPCHQKEGDIWSKSKHAVALRTLERDGSDADPECVGCHVVGLHSEQGFRSRQATPYLPNVGCESCHGPGKDHAENPKASPMPRVGQRSCMGCHDPQNSPLFDFPAYWKKIAH